MTSKDKLKNICNYIESSIEHSPSTINISILEMMSDADIAEEKRKKRELVIDITIGDKSDDEWSKLETTYNVFPDNLEKIHTISHKVINLSLGLSSYKNYDEVYNYVINFVDKYTSNSKLLQNGSNSRQFDIKMSGGNYPPEYTYSEKLEADLRKIITKINLTSSVISIEGRIGPAKSILIGEKNWIYFREIENKWGSINNLNFIYDKNIDPNKVIVFRNNDNQHPGIFLIENSGNFYIKETPNWHRQFCWFWIT